MPIPTVQGDREYCRCPKSNALLIKFRCFRSEDGQKAERWMTMPAKAFAWFMVNVQLEVAGGHGRSHIFSWPGPTGLHRKGNHDSLADYLRGLFGHLYDGSGRIPFRREEILGLANHLNLTPKITGQNPNPNKNSKRNYDRLTQTTFVPRARR